MQTHLHSQLVYPLKIAGTVVLAVVLVLGVMGSDALAQIETVFLYRLSSFDGPVPFNWANIQVDETRKEVYVADTRNGEIQIFNNKGMQIYRFGDDGSLGTILDVAVKSDGNILVLSRTKLKSIIRLCNYMGIAITTLDLQDLPPDFSDFSPSRIVYKFGQLYLLDSRSLRLAVTDPNGNFIKGYDIGAMIEADDNKRAATEIGGFSVDREANMLFTIPVLFRAYKLTPDEQLSGFGRPGSAPGRFNVVGGIVADDKGYYYVADRLKSAIIVFDKDFKFQTEFGYRGRKPHNLIGPKNLGLDNEGKLYVSQLSSKGVSVFKITHK